MLQAHDEEPIIAQCTPSGSGAIALLRLTGVGAVAIADALSALPSGKKLSEASTHTIHFGYVVDRQRVHIDQVLFLLMRAPHTFTGQDTVEITCHNNAFIIQAIIGEAISHGARVAQPGEFSKRAVVNEKIDLLQAEAINELIHANTQHALKQSLAQLKGTLSCFVADIEQELVRALALSEASFEFLDEEYLEFGAQIHATVTHVRDTITNIKKQFNEQSRIREGLRIALVGSVNAGKSSLFNALLGADRAIVTPIAGTTRDVIEAGVYRNGNYWTLVDTAGIRETDDIIEQEGIRRSFDEAHRADIILAALDSSRPLTNQEQTFYEQLASTYGTKAIIVLTKSDTQAHTQFPALAGKHTLEVSTVTSHNMPALEELIEHMIGKLLGAQQSCAFLLNKRHFSILLTVEQKLEELDALLHASRVPYELVSYHLNDLLATLCELTGKSVSERGMDAVFREFCVGK